MNSKKKRVQSREDAPWSKRQEIPAPQIFNAASQYEIAFKVLGQQPPGSGVGIPQINIGAVAVELYLKSLSAELIYIEDNLIPEASYVYSKPAIMNNQGHGLVGLLEVIPEDICNSLTQAFDSEFSDNWDKELITVLESLEGVFSASRYPFEYGKNIPDYGIKYLSGLVDFLGRFTRNLQPKEYIEWK